MLNICDRIYVSIVSSIMQWRRCYCVDELSHDFQCLHHFAEGFLSCRPFNSVYRKITSSSNLIESTGKYVVLRGIEHPNE